ncbi:hypothetical protein FRC08_009612 [Ceratobasidium sp. 394]|nr:hypothetical protein FRC08_009612 [Ceratobasidium sp. 394]KAG9074425.1 hypothetical protein FS749_014015 [Ceratobasidium sp. UAMH 11750]
MPAVLSKPTQSHKDAPASRHGSSKSRRRSSGRSAPSAQAVAIQEAQDSDVQVSVPGDDGGEGDEHEDEGNTASEVTSKGGRQPGAATYTSEELGLLLSCIEALLPHGQKEWDKVTNMYNEEVAPDRRRVTNNLRVKFNRVLKAKKPTGTGEADEFHERALAVEEAMHNREEAAALDDEWSDSNCNDPPPVSAPDPTPVPDRPRPRPRPAVRIASPPTDNKGTTKPILKVPAKPPFGKPSLGNNKPIGHPSIKPHVSAPKAAAGDDSDSSDVVILTPVDRKCKADGAGPTFRAAKSQAVAVAPAKAPALKPCKPTDPALERLINCLDPSLEREANEARRADDFVRLIIYQRDQTIAEKERLINHLNQELSREREARHQAERSFDQARLLLTLKGAPLQAIGHSLPGLNPLLAPFLGPPTGTPILVPQSSNWVVPPSAAAPPPAPMPTTVPSTPSHNPKPSGSGLSPAVTTCSESVVLGSRSGRSVL